MKLQIWTALSVAVLSSLGLLQSQEGKDIEKVQGTWDAVAMIFDGKPASKDHIKGIRLVVEGHKYSLQGGEQNYRGKLKLDTSQQPYTIDATFFDTEGTEKGFARGIYTLDRDHFKISWREQGGERPREFASTPGSKVRELILKREK